MGGKAVNFGGRVTIFLTQIILGRATFFQFGFRGGL